MASKPTVRLHPLAEQELHAAFRWYEERNELVAKILVIELRGGWVEVIALAHHRTRPGDWAGRT